MNHRDFLSLNAYQTITRSIQHGCVCNHQRFMGFLTDELPVCCRLNHYRTGCHFTVLPAESRLQDAAASRFVRQILESQVRASLVNQKADDPDTH